MPWVQLSEPCHDLKNRLRFPSAPVLGLRAWPDRWSWRRSPDLAAVVRSKASTRSSEAKPHYRETIRLNLPLSWRAYCREDSCFQSLGSRQSHRISSLSISIAAAVLIESIELMNQPCRTVPASGVLGKAEQASTISGQYRILGESVGPVVAPRDVVGGESVRTPDPARVSPLTRSWSR